MGFNPAPSPIGDLNIALGGGAPAGAVTLLGAPPGMGKSSLALDWAYQYAVSGRPALFVSLELNELDLYSRLCTLRKGHSWIAVRCGKYKDDLMDTIAAADRVPFYSTTRNETTSPETLMQPVAELTQRYGASPLVVVDYIQQFIPADAQKEQWALMSDISTTIAHIAQDTGCPMICITAVNRQSYNLADKDSGKPDRYLALAAAKQSGRLEYDAEVIMGLQLFEATEDGQYGWICIAKNRSGGGTTNIPVKYDGLSGAFYSASEDDIHKAMSRAKEGTRTMLMKEVEAKVLDALSVPPCTNIEEWAKTAGVPKRKCKEALGKLMANGQITRANGALMTVRRD
jgi:replicative DNA helicase